jgi:hypothetical protein
MSDIWIFLKSDGGRVALAVTAILVSLTLFVLNRKSKKLVYKVVARTRVLSVKKELADKVQILYEGVPVGNVGLFQIRIINSGSEPIRAADFVRPIAFVPLPGTRIIEANIDKTEPAAIGASLTRENGIVTISPILLNSKNFLEIKMLIENFDGNFSIDSRIEGVELKPGRKKGPLEQTIVETTGFGIIMAILLLGTEVSRKLEAALLTATFWALLLFVSKKLPFSAEAPNDYQ